MNDLKLGFMGELLLFMYIFGPFIIPAFLIIAALLYYFYKKKKKQSDSFDFN
jgi:hypothetical protein